MSNRLESDQPAEKPESKQDYLSSQVRNAGEFRTSQEMDFRRIQDGAGQDLPKLELTAGNQSINDSEKPGRLGSNVNTWAPRTNVRIVPSLYRSGEATTKMFLESRSRSKFAKYRCGHYIR